MKLPVNTHSILLGAMLVIALAGCGKSPEELVQDGKASFEKSDYKTAILELKSALQEQPGNREARLLLGKAHLANGAYADAEKELTTAQEQGASYDEVLPALAKSLSMQNKNEKVLGLTVPSSLTPQSIASLHVSRAAAFMRLGKRYEAEQALQMARQADPKYPELLLYTAGLALLDQNRPEALRIINSVLADNPGSIDALYMKASFLMQENKDAEAIQVFKQLLAKDQRQVRAHLGLAQIYLRSGKVEDAEKAQLQAEKISGNAPLVQFQRAILELSRGKLKEANESLQQVLKAIPDHPPAVLTLASVSYELGNYEQSLKHGQKVLAKDPGSSIATWVVAASQFKTGDAKAALATLQPLLKSGAKDAQLFILAAEIHSQNKEFDKAMNYFDRALALDPNNSELLAKQAVTHLQQGDDRQAFADLQRAVRLSDKPGKADLTLITLHIQRKQFDAALQAIAAFDKKSPNNPMTNNLRAAVLADKQDLAGARRELERALTIQPDFIAAAISLAQLDLIDKNLPSARKRFESVLAKDPNNMMAMLAMSDLAKLENKDSEYISWLERAAKAHPEAMKPNEQLVRHYLARKENGKAMAIAREVFKANPGNPEALNLLGTVQAISGASSDAIASFNALLEKSGNAPRGYLQLAMVQFSEKQPQQARTSLTRALQLQPDYVEAQDMLIRLELSEQKPDAALQIARQMQQQNQNSATGFEREGEILSLQKRYPQATKAFELAVSKAPSSHRFIKLHQAQLNSGDVKGAEARLTAWLNTYPRDVVVRKYVAQTYIQARRNLDAIKQYEAILKVTPNDVLALNNLADLYQQGNDARALATAEQALKQAPDNASVMNTLGWILVDHGQFPRAIDLLRKSVEKEPNSGLRRYHLGVALSKNGNKADARKELEAAVATGQNFPDLENAKALLKTL